MRLLLVVALLLGVVARAQPLLENLSRGVVAVHQPDGRVFISWRLLGTDPADVAFNVYRTTAPAESGAADFGAFASRPDPRVGTVKLNPAPLSSGTWFVDDSPVLHRATSYEIRPVVDGAERPTGGRGTVALAASAPPLPYHSVPLQTPPGYRPGDASLGDLDGDGDYEIVLKQEQNPQDNSRPGKTGETLLQAYQLDGTLRWTINLGKNIREGAHYTQFMVYDLDGDGRAEVACKTADGTIDGVGKVIGDATADHRSEQGHILKGPEFLTVFDGRTGAALATVDYVPARHPTKLEPAEDELKSIWGDGHGNRSDRYLAGIAYLDGSHPSLIMCRGYYTRAVVVAWDWRGGKLTRRWTFDSDDGTPGNDAYRGQGFHSLSVADVDDDGRQEIIYGAAVIDDDGKGLHSTGWGHGDALHVTDHVPSNPGLEVFGIQERFDQQGMNMRDARIGRAVFTVPSVKAAESGGDKGEGPGRGVAFNIDPRYPGSENWASGAEMTGVYSATGERIVDQRPRRMPCNFAVWWDGDLQRELLDQNFVLKWNWHTNELEPLLIAHACTSINGTKATPAVSADLWGDWREEIVWPTRDGRELRIYTSTIPTPHRMPTLMHDAQYRVAIAWQNVAYNQPPHPSFYLGDEASLPKRPPVGVVR
ncbi:MAG TPA: rhamnogalacturonan lyase [Opitutaceae bacterium]